MKTREEVLSVLRRKKKEFSKFGIIKIGLFGSYVRNEQSPKSDIDVLIDFDPDFSVFMEETIIKLLSEKDKNVGCARFRGVSLYLMILQWYYMVRQFEFFSLRQVGFLNVIRNILHNSQLPLGDVLIKGSGSELVKLFLQGVRHYKMIDGLNQKDKEDKEDKTDKKDKKDLLKIQENITKMGLIKKDSEDVVVMNVPYTNDAVSCSSSPKRHAILEIFGDTKYPCSYTQDHVRTGLKFIKEHVLRTDYETNRTRQDNSVSPLTISNKADKRVFHANDDTMFHSANTQYSSARS
jgi:predicted nucleotidyltransferase